MVISYKGRLRLLGFMVFFSPPCSSKSWQGSANTSPVRNVSARVFEASKTRNAGWSGRICMRRTRVTALSSFRSSEMNKVSSHGFTVHPLAS